VRAKGKVAGKVRRRGRAISANLQGARQVFESTGRPMEPETRAWASSRRLGKKENDLRGERNGLVGYNDTRRRAGKPTELEPEKPSDPAELIHERYEVPAGSCP